MLLKIENMRKWIVQFLRKFENRGIKIARINSIRITKSIDSRLFLIMYGVGRPLWSKAIFITQSIYREIYDNTCIALLTKYLYYYTVFSKKQVSF